jgi:RHS repeat-associated protein
MTPERLRVANSLCRVGVLCTFVVLALAFGATVAVAQSSGDYSLQVGSPQFATVEPVELGFVNAANGDLHLEIPLVSLPGRGTLGFTAKLVYDSRIWEASAGVWHPDNVSIIAPGAQGGWRLSTSASGYITYNSTFRGCVQPPTGTYYIYTNYTYTDPSGTSRTFAVQNYESGCTEYLPGNQTPVETLSGPALDSSGYYMNLNAGSSTVASVYAPDGTKVYPQMEDTNGNCFTVGSGSAGSCANQSSGNMYDTLNRQTVIPGGGGNTTTYTIPTSEGSSTFTVTTSTVNYNTDFQESGVTEASGSFSAPTQIELPDGTSYYFQYDSSQASGHYGLLTQITLPTGGVINYTHANFTDVNGNVNQWVSTRTSGGGEWTYAPATCGTGCQNMTVTRPSSIRPSGDQTVHTFTMTAAVPMRTSVAYYTGLVSGNILLATITNNYTTYAASSDFGGTAFITPTNTQVVTTSPSGNLTSETDYTYDQFYYIYQGTQYTGSRGNLQQALDYGYGVNGKGALVRQRLFTYLEGSYLDATTNIVNRVTDAKTEDANGDIHAETQTTYDSATPKNVTGVTHHDDAGHGPSNTTRGNPGVIQQCSSAPAASCSSWISATLNYDTTGQVISVVDPNNDTTSFSYADSYYSDNSTGSNPPAADSPGVTTNAYVTQITRPETGSVNHVSNRSYYYNTGDLARTTDENTPANVTWFHHSDVLDRPTHTYFPDGGWQLASYPSETQINLYTGLNTTTPQTTCSVTSNPPPCRADQVNLDSLGRLITNALVSDPAGEDSVDTTYDVSGLVYTVSNPHRSGSLLSDGLETISSRDGLGRVLLETHADKDSLIWEFGSNAGGTQLCSTGTYGYGYPTLFKDETGTPKREIWTDALGRVIEADEPNPSSGNSLTWNTCYTYDPLGNLGGVAQGSQTRTYKYDELSRLTSSIDPEIGGCTVGYGYDGNSNLTSRAAPKPNQTSCATTDTTTYTYDALNRLTQKSYSDGTTPTVYFDYDEPSWSNLTLSRTVGRLSYAWTTAPGNNTAYVNSVYSYDPLGRVAEYWQCTPGNCGGAGGAGASPWAIPYTYDLGGDVTSWTHPAGFTVSNTINSAQQITQVECATGCPAPTPATLATVAYTPFGAVSTLENGCAGSGCTNALETYSYNDRLQTVMIEVGTPSSAYAHNCLVYNYYAGEALPGTCTTPTQTAINDTGNVWGYTYQDFVNTSESHIATFGYDALNRLQGGEAWSCTSAPGNCSPSSTVLYNLAFSYDRYGNMTCTQSGSTQGPCPQFTYGANNQMATDAGNPASYDAAGNLTNDGNGNTYQYDAEGRGFGGTYNAFGWGVVGSPYSNYFDPSGLWLGNTYGSSILHFGHRTFAFEGNNAMQFIHESVLGSTAMATDQTGNNVTGDLLFYPWGQAWQGTDCCEIHWAAFQWGGGNYPAGGSLFRTYQDSYGRWLTPDPAGLAAVDLTNPQSLNRYAYVGNNPTTLVDPSGLFTDLPLQLTGYDPFSLYGIPVVGENDVYVPIGSSATPGQTIGVTMWSSDDQDIVSSSIDQTLGVNGLAGVWVPQNLGDAFTLFGADLSGLFGSTSSAVSQFAHSRPWQISWIVPVWPVPGVLGAGPAGSVAYNPATHNACFSIGGGIAGGHSIAAGPLTNAVMWDGTSAFPSGVDSILSGVSVSFGWNAASPMGGPGFQGVVNGSGAAGGVTWGAPGGSIAVTWAACHSF